MQAIATKLGQLITPPCITGECRRTRPASRSCSVVEHLTDSQGVKKDIALPELRSRTAPTLRSAGR